MKSASLLLAMVITVSLSAQDLTKGELSSAMKHTKKERAEKDKEFRDRDKSPLVTSTIPDFKGLNYFDIDPNYVVKASYIRIDNGREFEMATNTRRKPLYIDYALISFQLEGKRFTVHAYQNVEFSKSDDYDNTLFLPFNDLTNGLTTYGGGRYLDVEIPEGHTIILNFNEAYNPYCSYNPKYSCPIPPDENKLEISIPAGEKKYH